MTASHAAAVPSSARADLDALLDDLAAGTWSNRGVEEIEIALRERLDRVGRAALAEELARRDVQEKAIVVDGVVHRLVLRSEKAYLTRFGDVNVVRSLYRATGEELSIVPMELQAGIIDGYWTPGAARLATWTVTHLTPGATAELFERCGGMRPSASSLDRLPKALSAQWEENRETFEKRMRVEPIPAEAATVAVSLDGVMAPMRDGKRGEKRAAAAAAGKDTRGPAGFQEVGCGTVSLYAADGKLLRTVRMGRMPEKNKASLKLMLTEELDALLIVRPDLRVVKVADGAKDNWTFLDRLVASGTSILDYYHAAQHLNAAVNAVHGEDTPKSKAESSRLRHVLRDDDKGVNRVITAIRRWVKLRPRSKTLARELAYFERNREKMRYARWSAMGMPIGSGVVEAACKTLVVQRMKRAGQRWRADGGQAILTFRGLAQSGRFDRGFDALAGLSRVGVGLPNNVLSFPHPAGGTTASG
jgi:hypothetical protein